MFPRLRRLVQIPNVIRKDASLAGYLESLDAPPRRVLNLGSGEVRLWHHAVNVDIQPEKEVDVVADAHRLPFIDGAFDLVVMIAVLQYCKNPTAVVHELSRVLAPGGRVYVDAPFMQPYCRDTKDRFRFSHDGLLGLFEDAFVVESCRISISGPSALAYALQSAVEAPQHRYLEYAAKYAVSVLVWPMSRIRCFRSPHYAGAFCLAGRKPQ